MKWIEFLEDRGSFKKGARIEKEDAAAKDLIDLGIAKAATAPEVEPVDAAKGVIAAAISSAVADGIAQLKKDLEPVTKRLQHPTDDGYELGTAKKLVVPPTAKRFSSVRSFQGPEAAAKAYWFGTFCLALKGKTWARRRLAEHGINLVRYDEEGDGKAMHVVTGALTDAQVKAATEQLNSDAAFLVPEEFGTDIIDLREKFGIARQLCKIVPMTTDTRIDPRRRDGVATYYVGEGQAGTQADKTWDQVRLVAKKLMALTKWSSEVSEDAVINIGDDLANEFAYGFAIAEDSALIKGDASSTYGGITGIKQAFTNVHATITNQAGSVQGAAGTGASWGFVLSDFNKVIARLPEYADGNARWLCSKAFWGQEMQRLAMAAGGNKVGDITDGARKKEFAGYEVVISQIMPKTPANSDLVAVYGDIRSAVSFGTRREIAVAMSNAALNAFEQDQMVLRATERYDLNVHDVGDPTSGNGTSRSAQYPNAPGPIVALWTAAS